MSTFIKEITYKSRQLSGHKWVKENVTKSVHFNELDETIKSQHKLHFRITSLWKTIGEGDEKQIKIDSDSMYDITVEAIKQLVVVNENFTETDLAEFLSDSKALLKFGSWFTENHLIPFMKDSAL